MKHSLIKRLYEAITGTPWTTVRSCTAEFGPTPGARYADQLAAYSDAELLRGDRDEILAQIHREQAANLAARAERQRAA